MTAQLVRFPRSRKRGAKVRTGPSASLLTFPVGLVGAELQRRWVWLNRNWARWGNEAIDGERDPDDRWSVETSYMISQVAQGRVPADQPLGAADPAAREDVRRWEAHIRKRTAVKDWLESLGVDWDHTRSAEEALFFAFDRLGGRRPSGGI